SVGPDATGEWKLGTGSELEWPEGTQAGDGNSGVAQIISSTEGAIGYVDLSYFAGWADGDDAYPIAAQTWIIAYTKQDDAAKAEAIRGFLTYLLTEGQTLAPTIDFAPLPAELQAKAMENIAKIG